ncbi:hypothetical protein CONCODRAFT_72764 [Conidiobolus coronatus NRRL 28638]|uniref:RNI-like protein n=1 Tax=Conidiobolus coronatus (strain ATCC 28846 / CBS 209.66 / NRRL 28638) TaxID=796925 RepID=A0A137NYG4_CONC2|nr:hypothetical protein CONCODRAFT_72764 [Conidiobolus coronatus NRRL 28638]|eukprot:KXN67711.1 hypothetical protein CONCODRAFT_72764 [Conidiobolus coronatus NRRL 28638]
MNEANSVNYYGIENEFDRVLETIPNFQSNRIDPFMADLIKMLNNFDIHLKQVEFDRLYRPGLSICECELDLKSFNKFILKLDKLESLSIKNLQFLVLDEEWPLDGETLLPQGLKELELGNMCLRRTDLHKNPYKFLFIDNSGFMNVYFYIPPQRLPNLKKLTVSKDTAFYSNYIPNLLDLNPQLTHVTFPYYYLSSCVGKYLNMPSNINEVQVVFKFENYDFRNFNITPLDSVNILSIKSINSNHYRKVYTLINLCPKLTKLHASFDYFDDEFIERLLRKLDHLKAIELEIGYFRLGKFDLSIFSNIESLRLNISSNQTINYKLPAQPSKLKSIKISSDSYRESFNFMLKECSSSPTWNIKLLGSVISCSAILT